MLFKIGRKLSTSGAISSIYEIYNPPFIIKALFFIFGFSFKNNEEEKNNLTSGKKLCSALQNIVRLQEISRLTVCDTNHQKPDLPRQVTRFVAV